MRERGEGVRVEGRKTTLGEIVLVVFFFCSVFVKIVEELRMESK